MQYFTADRRRHHRYRLELEAAYTMLQGRRKVRKGTGRTFDISNAAVSFRSDQPFEVGAKVQLSIDWPVAKRRMFFNVAGTVLRSETDRTVVKIVKYRFVDPAASRSSALPAPELTIQ